MTILDRRKSVGLKNMVKLQGCMVNALVPEVDERRDKLRYAAGRSKYPVIRRFLNGGTLTGESL